MFGNPRLIFPVSAGLLRNYNLITTRNASGWGRKVALVTGE